MSILNEISGILIEALPNVIVIQPDDLPFFDPWTSPTDNPIDPVENPFPNRSSYALPHLERLRTQGVQMMQAYTASPSCGTSRYSTITGKYPSRSAHGRDLFQNNEDRSSVTIPTTKLVDLNGQNDCSEENLAAAFQQNGYRTGMIGKWHLFDVKRSEYDYSEVQKSIRDCGFNFTEGIYVENFGSFSDGSFSHNMEWVTKQAVDFINDDSSTDPFFLYLNPTVPHNDEDVEIAIKNFTCMDTPEGLLTGEPRIKGMTINSSGNFIGCEAYRQTILDRAGSEFSNKELGAIWIDDGVGAILRALEDNGQLDNTIIIFQQDHGIETKKALYENGIRIAQFVHYPGALWAAGTTFSGLVSTIDIGPTLFDYAGITLSSPGYYNMDGQSWKDAIGNTTKESAWKDERCLFFEMQLDRAVRCGCEKYINIPDPDSFTAKKGHQSGLAVRGDLYFQLCDSSGNYLNFPNSNPEQRSRARRNRVAAGALSEVLSCFLNKTSPSNNPDYVTTCVN
jgi:arylsulfatase A-like enzyme